MSALSISAISKSFGTTEVLRDVSLEISSGEFFFILGPSGCGKSTLLRIIAGLERADRGSVCMDGRPIDGVPPHLRGIGMVFQSYALWPHMTVSQNISFGLEVRGTPTQETRARVREALDLVRLAGFENRYPHELSGGQQQRVALARALVIRPSVILLDEPLSNLDARLRDEIRSELASLHRTLGVTMVYVTHDQEDALTLGTRVALLNSGRVEQQGSPSELYEHPHSLFVAQFLGDANLIRCQVEIRPDSQRAVARLPAPHSLQYEVPLERSGAGGGGPALICIRPESITLVAPHTPHPSPSIEAEIRQVNYRGGWCDLVMEGPEGISLRMRMLCASKEEEAPQVGERVQVAWKPEHSVLIPDPR